MILLNDIENKIKNQILSDKIEVLNVLIPRMSVEDSLVFLSNIEFLNGIMIGITLAKKARELNNFDKEYEIIKKYISNIENLYELYFLKKKNEPN